MPYSLLVQILFHPSLRLGSHSFIMPYPILVIALVVDNLQVPSLKPRAFGCEDSRPSTMRVGSYSLCHILYCYRFSLTHQSLRLGSHSFIMPDSILLAIALVVDNLLVSTHKTSRAFGGEDSLSPIINARGVSLLNCAIFYTRQSESNLRSSVNTRGTNKIVQLLFHLRYHTAVTFSRPVARCARIFSSMSTSHIVLL